MSGEGLGVSSHECA